jgi:hypothetical protein
MNAHLNAHLPASNLAANFSGFLRGYVGALVMASATPNRFYKVNARLLTTASNHCRRFLAALEQDGLGNTPLDTLYAYALPAYTPETAGRHFFNERTGMHPGFLDAGLPAYARLLQATAHKLGPVAITIDHHRQISLIEPPADKRHGATMVSKPLRAICIDNHDGRHIVVVEEFDPDRKMWTLVADFERASQNDAEQLAFAINGCQARLEPV